MFGRKAIEAIARMQDYERDKADQRYWDLRQRHERLLRVLGMVEVTTPGTTAYQRKSDAKPGE